MKSDNMTFHEARNRHLGQFASHLADLKAVVEQPGLVNPESLDVKEAFRKLRDTLFKICRLNNTQYEAEE